MPALILHTNVKVADARAFVKEFSALAAEFLGKPEQYISVCYNYNENLSFAGTFEPAFLLTITDLLNFSAEANEKYSKIVSAHFEKTLGTSNTRGYITFLDPGGRVNMGYMGTTVEKLFQ